jgi:cellulose synthase operon protein C
MNLNRLGTHRPTAETRLMLSLIGALTTTLLIAVPAPAQPLPAEVRQGLSELERGWVNDAIATFRRALQRHPQSLEAKLGLAQAYQRAGQDANAWQAYQAVLQQAPNQPEALAAVGELGAYRPEWQAQGIAALTALLTQNPNNTAARAQRALLYGYQGQFSEALADYARLLPNNPSPDTVLGAAQIYTYSGDYTQGLGLFRRYLAGGRTVPDNAISAYALALQESGQSEAAVAVLTPRLRPATDLDPVAVQIRTALATAYGSNGQMNQALATLAPLRGQPSARLALARALSALGRRHDDAALFGEATELYQQALRETTAPSFGLRREVADVLSEWPPTRPQALALLRSLAQENSDLTSLQVQTLTLAHTLGELAAPDLAAQLTALLMPLPAAAAEQRAIALALVRLENPEPVLLPVYEGAIAAGLDEPLLRFRIAQMQLGQNNLAAAQSALAAYRETTFGRSDLAVDLLLADLERQMGDLEASGRRYETLIAAAPSPAIVGDALRGLAFVRTLQGQPERAVAVYEQVMQADPSNLTWPLGWAYLTHKAGSLSEGEAAKRLDQWLAANPLDNPPPEVWQLTAALAAAPERASLYEALLALDPKASGIRWRQIQLLAQRDPALAEAEVAALVAASPDDPTVYFYQGELAQQQGDLRRASQAYETILALDPNQLGALSALAGVRFQQGRLEDARRLYEAVLAQEPEDWGVRLAIAELNAAQDYRLTARQQLQTLPPQAQSEAVSRRIEELRVDLLRRRGFQPPWERY